MKETLQGRKLHIMDYIGECIPSAIDPLTQKIFESFDSMKSLAKTVFSGLPISWSGLFM